MTVLTSYICRILTEILTRDPYSVNDEDYEAQTALHLAAAAGHVKALSLLLTGGADLEAEYSQYFQSLIFLIFRLKIFTSGLL